uniref:TIL domain-containing protein n=1 Tax=Strongyloides venezuelensis TaxID=75913 RepID=A0A0K0F1N5_STRVS
ACEEKCSDDNKKPCPYKCNGRGCQCKPLYLRDDVTGKCVKREECTKTTTLLPPTTRRCKMNEYFTLCGSACEPRCSDYNKINNWCTLQCVIGCECYKGFVRNDYTNECIRSSECPVITTRRPPTKQCDANSTFNTCKSPCPDKCSEKPSKIKICTRNCAGIGCECLRGYVINDVGGDGKCILRKDCPVATTSSPETTPRCPKNMVYTDCKSACEPRCGISLETSGICTMECAGKGCECRAPFALNDHGECVEREKCKKSPSGGYYIIHLLRKTITSMYTLIFKH